ncbi:Hsp20 family protein [Arenibaculum pallidiluteum]|uniref:Hsp20 family protein n=1 Tax=Arenibaculum pallidiluteum TaxID=2812559 RepID=UPI001A9771BB|nr:Hsp20 family protein [Arenibaculum pallidiluteum]
MRSALDPSPLYRNLIGFDRLAGLLDDVMRLRPSEGPPHYDIERTGENAYRITLAVAGLGPDDLEISTEPNLLRVRGRKPVDTASEVLHRGITLGNFERRFELADHVRVERASLDGGLLRIELLHELPDTIRPRRIPIGSASARAKARRARQSQRKAA